MITNTRNCALTMDPAASQSMTYSGNKRKNITPSEHEQAKRRKTLQESEEKLETGRESRSARICAMPDLFPQPITLNELVELLHYAALGKTGGNKKPSWCRLFHQRKIKALNVVIVEGLSQSDFYRHYLSLRHLRSRYTTRVTFTPSPTDIASAIFSSELPKSDSLFRPQRHGESSQLDKALRIHPVITAYGTQRRGLTAYVLTQEEMIKKHFPVKGVPGFEEFACTDSVACVTDSSPLFGLDCEMCLTGQGYELARVSLVDSDGKCLLDQLVKPQNHILNYLTCFSGITAAMLRPVRTTLRDVQAQLRTLLPSDAVLVGHSINNDLMALKMIHQHVIDTSLLYRRQCGQKFKLKVLTEVVLNKKIQTEDRKGHNPTEDAVAALELAHYFIRMGPCRVVELHMEELWGYKVEEASPDCASSPPLTHRFADVLQTHGRSVAFIGKRADVALSLSNQVWQNSDKQVLASFRSQTKCPFLSVIQLSSFSDQMKRRPPHQEVQDQRSCTILRNMCVVFAGPFPAGFSQREVKRLFCCCGPVHKIRMLHTAVRLHAEIQFELLEGAALALATLNGLNVQGQNIKVQRPVDESLLDLELTLDALACDHLNSSHLYAVKLTSTMAGRLTASAEVSAVDASANTPPPARVNGAQFQHDNASKTELSEETVRETFSHFGPVERVLLPTNPGCRARRHAHIQFNSPADKRRALSSSEELRKQNYLVSSTLTPTHLTSWVAMTMLRANTVDSHQIAAEGEESHTCIGSQDQDSITMLKLDRRLRRLFRSLPDGTLSVVILGGHHSAHSPGLCLLEVKQDPQGETGSS
eukprot:XP_011611130.1 PREDICTED: putative RNA exonuclease NEF-sp isoform X2 [Takifugu rubripes]